MTYALDMRPHWAEGYLPDPHEGMTSRNPRHSGKRVS